MCTKLAGHRTVTSSASPPLYTDLIDELSLTGRALIDILLVMAPASPASLGWTSLISNIVPNAICVVFFFMHWTNKSFVNVDPIFFSFIVKT